MNAFESNLPRRAVILLVIGMVTCALLTAVTGRLLREWAKLAAAQHEEEGMRTTLRMSEENLLRSRQEIALAKRKVAGRELEEKRVKDRIRAFDPESQWTTPPSGPGWNHGSPYVWLSKDSVRQLPVRAFGDSGGLLPEVAIALMLEPAKVAELNRDLGRILEEYRALEAAQARPVEEPLPGVDVKEPHLTLEVRPFPKEGAALKERFETTLQDALGEQRAQLVLATSEGWLSSQFALAREEPKVISVVRHANGTYNLAVKTGDSWRSIGGFRDLSTYLPPHLLPFFADSAFEGNTAQQGE